MVINMVLVLILMVVQEEEEQVLMIGNHMTQILVKLLVLQIQAVAVVVAQKVEEDSALLVEVVL